MLGPKGRRVRAFWLAGRAAGCRDFGPPDSLPPPPFLIGIFPPQLFPARFWPRQAREIVAANGFSDVITIIKGKIEEIELPVAHVDVIVSRPRPL